MKRVRGPGTAAAPGGPSRNGGAHPRLEIRGDPDPARRIGVASGNLRKGGGRDPPSEIRDRPAQRPRGHSVAGRKRCDGPYGHAAPGDPRDDLRTVPGGHPAGLLRDQARLVPGRIPLYGWTTRTPTTSSKPSASVALLCCELLLLYRFDLRSGTWVHGRDPLASTDSRGIGFRAGDDLPAVRCPLWCASASSGPTWDEAEVLAAELSTSTPQAGGTLPGDISSSLSFLH